MFKGVKNSKNKEKADAEWLELKDRQAAMIATIIHQLRV